MSASLVLVLVVVAAYLAAHVAFDWLGRRFLIASGAEYLVLGILLGPQVSGVLSRGAVESLAPVTTLALGWIGAVVGVQYYLPSLVSVSGVTYRVALGESCITFLFVAAIETVAIGWLFGVPLAVAAAPACALGGIATASSSAGVALAARHLNARGAAVMQLGVSSLINGTVAVIAFGIIASIWHPAVFVFGRAITPTEWVAVTLGIGVVGGVLFHLFVGAERNVDRLFISLAGGVIIVSGAASYVRVSPLLSALCFGAILVNTSRARDEIVAALERVERPFYFVLLVFAGAAWRPSTSSWLPVVLLFLAARTASKLGGARLAARANGLLPALGRNWGRALIGQGPLALAIALNYVYQGGGEAPYMVFTAAVASVLLTDLLSPQLVRSVLAPILAGAHAPWSTTARRGSSVAVVDAGEDAAAAAAPGRES
ncbi:MAG TPA: hypothetical protein VFJ74_06485 [Gemmatimonadaceae bacterium]|nr:hypothetical protein [Gemmatimonadaceae bacterium]